MRYVTKSTGGTCVMYTNHVVECSLISIECVDSKFVISCRMMHTWKPQHRFAYQCLDNIKMYKYAKIDQNISCGSRVIDAQRSLVIVLHTSGWSMLTYISM